MFHHIVQTTLLFIAAVFAGMLNSVAGGGSFITFPALLLAGVPPVSANATNTVALWPGSVASVGAYRRELRSQRSHIVLFGAISMIGGLLGALLLLRTRDALFQRMIPYLMLTATVIFFASPVITRFLQSGGPKGAVEPTKKGILITIYLAIAVYGGFFGAGIGILTLAVFSLLGFGNIHEMNALKTLQAALINGIAVIAFVLAGIIQWPQALAMTVGATAGGYGGATLARRLPTRLVRAGVILVGFVLTVYFFMK